MPDVTLNLSGLLAPGNLSAWSKEKKARVLAGLKQGMRAARPDTDKLMREEVDRAFNMRRTGAGRLRTSWRVNVYADRGPAKMVIKNLAKWFKIHTTGGMIGPKSTPRAILIPINTYLDSRLGTKKFYAMIDWLRREKLTVIKDSVLYVKPPMNESRRGGVAVGTRVRKDFRRKFQGSSKRPSGFGIKLNAEGLTPIAIIRTRITMKKRMDLQRIATDRVLPIVARHVNRALSAEQFRL